MVTPLPSLHLTIVPNSEPITGSYSTTEGLLLPFHGWIELAAVIERVRAAAFDPPPTSEPV